MRVHQFESLFNDENFFHLLYLQKSFINDASSPHDGLGLRLVYDVLREPEKNHFD